MSLFIASCGYYVDFVLAGASLFLHVLLSILFKTSFTRVFDYLIYLVRMCIAYVLVSSLVVVLNTLFPGFFMLVVEFNFTGCVSLFETLGYCVPDAESCICNCACTVFNVIYGYIVNVFILVVTFIVDFVVYNFFRLFFANGCCCNPPEEPETSCQTPCQTQCQSQCQSKQNGDRPKQECPYHPKN
ncbi:hypothetical protein YASMINEVIRUS_1270 [Yasminevirus sp. GU-2018]|uniref:Uncharacterized protein n=1 Tax=Yasminevirus sp. GU-2018 TaxID=2420051 RepID=A0A5K0U9P6_9VIRU|nr:hypothetical protein YASMINEVIRUS_1270 [Yasminevirus sp. GU-2018]